MKQMIYVKLTIMLFIFEKYLIRDLHFYVQGISWKNIVLSFFPYNINYYVKKFS